MQDSLSLKPPLDALLGICVPRLYFTAIMQIEKHVVPKPTKQQPQEEEEEELWSEGEMTLRSDI